MTAREPPWRGPWVLGVDGCPKGWIGIGLALDTAEARTLGPFERFEELLEACATAQVIGVDMPIGFLDVAERGGRTCERAARKLLKRRAASVFPSPSRAALARQHDGYRDAIAANRAGGGPGLSMQAFAIFPKMNEIDMLMTPRLQERVRECHPELCFAILNGAPMMHGKKNASGRGERLELLTASGIERSVLDPHPFKRKDVAPDDLLDAAVAALTAARIARGEARVFPGDPPRDSKGLRMEIVA